jgi:hypothetical protein
MRRLFLVLMMMVGMSMVAWPALAQSPQEAIATMRSDQIVFSGPSTNGGYLEYVAAGRQVVAGGRDSSTAWIEINIDGQVVGWVPASAMAVQTGDLATLPVKGGLLDLGKGAYDVNDSTLRAAEIELIRIQRPMRLIGARWFRLQAFTGASCLNIPAAPTAPRIPQNLPEMERVQRELTYAQEQATLAIQLYQLVCDAGGIVDETLYNRGIFHLNEAYNTWNVVRLYMNEIAGLEFTVQ